MTGATVHQLLHGYEGGHRLLSSSFSLSNTAELTLLQRSDLSGPILSSAFDGYLTGYALPEDGLYVLSRTWSAPEVGRPGAVWTHSLVLNFADLAHLPDLRTLLALFRRPGGSGADIKTYGQPLQVTEDYIGNAQPPNEAVITHLVHALYLTPRLAVRMPADDRPAIEDALLRIWSQQWPRLRRHFSFCTGIMTASNPAFEDFDVLAGPMAWYHNQEGYEKSKNQTPEWLALAVADIMSNGGPLRSFLNQAGAEVDGSRRSFGPLVQLYEVVPPKRSEQVATAVELLMKLGRTEGLSRLKTRLLEKADDASLEAAKLEAMVTHHTLFPEAAEWVGPRATRLAMDAPQQATDLVRRLVSSDMPGAAVVLDAVAHNLDFSRIGSDLEFPVLLALTGVRPELVTTSVSWPTDLKQQRQLLQVLRNVPAIPPVLEKVLAHQLLRAHASLAPAAIDLLGTAMVNAILDDPGVDLYWAQAAANRPSDVRAWLRDAPTLSEKSLLVVAQCLDTDDNILRARQDLFVDLLQHGQQPMSGETLAFLYVGSMHFASEREWLIVRLCFESLYSLAADSALSDRALRLLSKNLQRLPFWRDWDTCEKLRRSLMRRFLERGWSGSHLLEIVRGPNELRACLDYLEDTDHGSVLLKKVGSAVRNGEGTEEQRRVLYQYGLPRR